METSITAPAQRPTFKCPDCGATKSPRTGKPFTSQFSLTRHRVMAHGWRAKTGPKAARVSPPKVRKRRRRRRHAASAVRPAAHTLGGASIARKGDVHIVPWDDGSYLIRIVDGRKELMVIGYPVEISVVKPKAGGSRG